LIEGTVTEEGVPTIAIDIGGRTWAAIVDTGFNGGLELPEALRPLVNAQYIGRLSSLLAADQQVEEDVYLVNFPFDGELISEEATFVRGDEILIGTELLWDHRLSIDFPSRKVVIEK
jgi:predicted aspartyl protease